MSDAIFSMKDLIENGWSEQDAANRIYRINKVGSLGLQTRGAVVVGESENCPHTWSVELGFTLHMSLIKRGVAPSLWAAKVAVMTVLSQIKQDFSDDLVTCDVWLPNSDVTWDGEDVGQLVAKHYHKGVQIRFSHLVSQSEMRLEIMSRTGAYMLLTADLGYFERASDQVGARWFQDGAIMVDSDQNMRLVAHRWVALMVSVEGKSADVRSIEMMYGDERNDVLAAIVSAVM